MLHRSTQDLVDPRDAASRCSNPIGADPIGADPIGADPIGADPIGAERIRAERIGLAIVLIVAGLIFFPNLGATRLWDEDEGFYASAAQEMFLKKDWVVPSFNGAMFGHKPPWMYWMMMIGYSLFGMGELGARFLSAVFGSICVLLTFQLGKLLFNLRIGVIGALVLASSIMFTVVGRSATPDSFLVGFTLAALYLFCQTLSRPEFEKAAKLPLISLIPIYAILGLGMLTKGPIAVAFPVFIMVSTYVVTQFPASPATSSTKLLRAFQHPCARPAHWIKACWNLRPCTGILVVLLVAGPWYLAVGWQTEGAFHREFFGVHHFQRATSAMEGHRGSLIYYPVSILIGMYPWTVATGPVLLCWLHRCYQTWQADFEPQQVQLDSNALPQIQHQPALAIKVLSIWSAIYLLIFSLAATKLPNYILPAYPAFALIFAYGFDAWLASPKSYSLVWPRGALGVLILVGAILTIAVPVLAAVQFGKETILDHLDVAPAVQKELAWLGLLGLPALIGGSIALFLVERNRATLAFSGFCAAAIATVVCLWNVATIRLDQLQGPQRLISDVRRNPDLQTEAIATFDFFRPSMVFYSGSAIRKCYTNEQVAAFFAEQPRGVLVVEQSRLDGLRQSLPANIRVAYRQAKFPETGELIALTCQPTAVTLQKPNFDR